MENFGRDLADLAGEGYRGFQQKFSPLVVRRALLLDGDQPIHRKVPVGWANISKLYPNFSKLEVIVRVIFPALRDHPSLCFVLRLKCSNHSGSWRIHPD